MKRYFKDLDLDTKIEIIMNNEDLKNDVYEKCYEEFMEQQLQEGELMFGENYQGIDIRDHYNSFFLVLTNWNKFLDNLDSDYLCSKGIDLYNDIMKLKEEYENIVCDTVEEEEKFDNLEEEIENKCKELLKICEDQLHKYENINEKDVKEYLKFGLEENGLYEDYYIIDNDYSKVYLDTTRIFK